MAQQVMVKYNPYRLETTIQINGKDLPQDSALLKNLRGRRLQEWITDFPINLRDELNTANLDVIFYGTALDWDDLRESFRQAKDKGFIKDCELQFREATSTEDIAIKIVNLFKKMQAGPVEELRSPSICEQFENINNAVFPIHVIATMSSGKSTLINAMLANKLMPSKNEACTAVITKILDNDSNHYEAIARDKNDKVLSRYKDLTLDNMNELNSNKDVATINVCGDIPFVDCKENALELVDTPGPNNARTTEHKNTTFRALNNDSNNLILYVLNGTQLSTNDDATLLDYVSKQMKKGGKQIRDRFLFVINKMDSFDPEDENISDAIQAAKDYLQHFDIVDPQIYPVSAFTALQLRTTLANIDIDNLTRTDERKLSSSARDALGMVDKFNDYESMHLEQYTSLSPSEQEALQRELREAEDSGDSKKQALIHCGICSLEKAITAYVKKYAKTKKVKDLVESFIEVLESAETVSKLKTQIATDEKMAQECADRATQVRKKIDEGKEEKVFKEKIQGLKQPAMQHINDEAKEQQVSINKQTTSLFRHVAPVITDRDEAKRLVSQFSDMSENAIIEFTTDMESMINHEIKDTGENILRQYLDMLRKIDEEATKDKELNFSTQDLIMGSLKTMKENAKTWCTDSFAAEQIDEFGKVTKETKTYYVKTGQREEKVADGIEKVKVGSHKEVVGTKQVENPRAKGFLGFFRRVFAGESRYNYENIYENVDDFEERVKYKTVMKDVFEERMETIEKYSVKTSDLQAALVSMLRKNLADGIKQMTEYASKQIDEIVSQFNQYFQELDNLIKKKYAELESVSKDEENKRETLQKNKEMLKWMENIHGSLNELLEI